MKKTILITLVILTVLLAAIPLTGMAQSDKVNSYSDITGKWYTDAVTNYGYNEIFSDGSGKFHPDKGISRIEFARLLHKALGISINYFVAPDVSDSFDDMKNTDIGASELIDLATTGIVERGGHFNPGGKLERDVMVHWLMNALDYEIGGQYVIPKIKLVPFNDDNDIAEAYKSQLHNAQLLRFIIGRGNNLFFPKDGATRAESTMVVLRLMTFMENYKPRIQVTPFAWVAQDGALNMTLTIQNTTDKDITITHTSGQHYDFKLFDSNGEPLYIWSMGKLFTMNVNATIIKPGESVQYSNALDKNAYAEIINKVKSMQAFIIGSSSDFTIDENGYAASIVK